MSYVTDEPEVSREEWIAIKAHDREAVVARVQRKHGPDSDVKFRGLNGPAVIATADGTIGFLSRRALRGRGRPPLTPGQVGDTSAHRVRLSEAHQEELARLVMDGVAGNASEAIRYLIEQSAKARR